MKKEKVIIDTDPGVDDTTAMVLNFFDKRLDIKLITTVSGNVDIEKATRNACHLLDLFNLDIPLAKGAGTAISRKSINAQELHGVEGMGGYTPPSTTTHQPMADDAVEAIYKVLNKHPKEVTIFVLGPHTNIGNLLIAHPDASQLIKQIVFMGGSPYGAPTFPDHDSFNIKSDPEAFEIVLNSKIPLTMIPSHIGRYKAQLDEKDVNKIRQSNDVGKFLAKTYETYWEPDLAERGIKAIATNDICTFFFFLHPEMFVSYKADITVDLTENIGRTYASFYKNGSVNVVVDVNRTDFLKLFFEKLKKLDKIKLNTQD